MLIITQGMLLSAMLFLFVASGGECWGYGQVGRISMLIVLAQIIVSGCVWLYYFLNLFNKDDPDRRRTFYLAAIHSAVSILLLTLFGYQIFSSVRTDLAMGVINFLVFLWIALLPLRIAIRKLIPNS